MLLTPSLLHIVQFSPYQWYTAQSPSVCIQPNLTSPFLRMATFNPINYRDFRSRVEQYDEATGRYEFRQLASYARIARHPLARSPMRGPPIIPNEPVLQKFQILGFS